MKTIKSILKKKEKEIMKKSLAIAFFKQAMALGIIESILKTIKERSKIEYPKKEISNKVFKEVKKIKNEDIEKILALPKNKLNKEREKIEKKIMNKL